MISLTCRPSEIKIFLTEIKECNYYKIKFEWYTVEYSSCRYNSSNLIEKVNNFQITCLVDAIEDHSSVALLHNNQHWDKQPVTYPAN